MVNKRRTTTEIKENCPTPSRKQATDSLGLSVTKKRETLASIQTNQTVPANTIVSKAEKTAAPNPIKEEIV